MGGAGEFLRAEWRHLAILNFEVDPGVLGPLVPRGTELDLWNGRCLVSAVGFLFLRTRVLGVAVPFHTDFPEVNLRFYVRRREEGEWRRGVVFVKEIVPRAAIAWAARTFYEERYVALPMSWRIDRGSEGDAAVRGASYRWRRAGRDEGLEAGDAGPPGELAPGSEAEFVVEHYWGYVARRDGTTVEYGVEHPSWRLAPARRARLDADARSLYGEAFGEPLARPPVSAYLVEGSGVTVRRGARLAP